MATLNMCLRTVRCIRSLKVSSLSRSLPNRLSNNGWCRPVATDTTTPSEEKPEENVAEKDEQSSASEAEKALKEATDKLSEQIDELQDKYKRALAETENVRRRMQKQIDDAKLFGIQGFCKDLLEVADILSRATESVPQEVLQENNVHLKTLYDGLCMTDVQLQKVFRKHGLEKIDPQDGEKFDPNIHEALFQQPLTNGKVGGGVATVSKIGYRLHTRTVRPALVGVYKNA